MYLYIFKHIFICLLELSPVHGYRRHLYTPMYHVYIYRDSKSKVAKYARIYVLLFTTKHSVCRTWCLPINHYRNDVLCCIISPGYFITIYTCTSPYFPLALPVISPWPLKNVTPGTGLPCPRLFLCASGPAVLIPSLCVAVPNGVLTPSRVSSVAGRCWSKPNPSWVVGFHCHATFWLPSTR